MANINATVTDLAPIGGATNAGVRIGLLGSTVRAAGDDTITVTNASEVIIALLRDTDDTPETQTYATNVITMTRSDTTNVLGIVVFRL